MYSKRFVFALLIITTACISNRATAPPMPAVHFLIENAHAKFLWSNYQPAVMLVSTPNRIIASGYAFTISAFDSKAGTVAWREETEEYISETVAQDSSVYTAKWGGLKAFDAQNGHLLWDANNLETGNALSLLVSQDNIFIQHQTGSPTVVLDLAGNFIERLDTSTARIPLAIESDILYYADVNGLNALDIYTNQTLWTAPIKNLIGSTSATTEELIYLDSERLIGFNSVVAVDKLSGNTIWKREKYEKIISNLCLLDENLYFLNADGFLIALDKTNGQEVAKLEFTNIPFLLYRSEEPQVTKYLIAADSKNEILAIAFGDSFQIMAVQILNP